MGALKYNSFYLSHANVLPLKTPNRNNIIFLHSFDSTIRVEDILDLTREYHNLLERREGGQSTSFTYDFGLLLANGKPYMLDDLGSPVRFGEEAYGYDEFGQSLHEYQSAQPFGFTGYQLSDVYDGQLYAQARQYEPTVGRFTAQDPHWNLDNMIYGDNPSILIPDPLAMAQANNLYAYTVNNPLRYIDPTGFNCEDDDNGLRDILREIWNDFRPTFDGGFLDGLSSALDLTEWGLLGGLLLRGISTDRAFSELSPGMQILLSNLALGQQAGRVAGVEGLFGKVPWIMLFADIGVNGVQDWKNGESIARIGSNGLASGAVGTGAIYGGTKAGGFLAAVLASSKKGGTVGLILGPKGALAGAVGGGFVGGIVYVGASLTGVTDWVSDQFYSGVRGVQNAWANRPKLLHPIGDFTLDDLQSEFQNAWANRPRWMLNWW